MLFEILHHDGNYVEQREQRTRSCLVNEPRRAHKFYAHVRSMLRDPLWAVYAPAQRKEMHVASMRWKKNKRPKKRVTCTS